MTVDPSDPIRRQEPDVDPGLAPDPEHEVVQAPPEDDDPGPPDVDD
jgi:hypothetical protein